MTKKKSLLQFFCAMLLIVPLAFILSACGHKHNFSEQWSNDATSHWHVCTEKDCTEVSDKANHVAGDWVITLQPTCTTTGEKQKQCKTCGYVIEKETISVLNHNYGAPTYTWNDDCTECTAKMVCGRDATHVVTDKAKITSAIKQNKTCELDEITTYTATFTNAAFTQQTKDVKTGDATGHSYTDGICRVCGGVEIGKVVKVSNATSVKAYATINEAITNAVNGDTITILADTTATANGIVITDKTLTIKGETRANDSKYILKAYGTQTVDIYTFIDVTGSSVVTFENLKIDGNVGSNVRALRVKGNATMNLINVEITGGNFDTTDEGTFGNGVVATDNAILNITDSRISGNTFSSTNTDLIDKNFGKRRYSQDLWMGSQTLVTITNSYVEYAYKNANNYSRNSEEGSLVIIQGESQIVHLYLEYDARTDTNPAITVPAAKCKFVAGTIENLHIANADGVTEPTVLAGNTSAVSGYYYVGGSTTPTAIETGLGD